MGNQKSLNVANEQAIKSFLYPKKVMAEEVLHKNPGARILPTQPVPDELPPVEAMVPILHKTCDAVAFYYTHIPVRGEMMTATRARTQEGKPIEPGAPMQCSSCGEHIEGADYLQVRLVDLKELYEASK